MAVELIGSLGIGYLFGVLSPAALLSRLKHQDLREKGTKNLGASNVMLVLGKGYGVIVMLFDILKAFVAAKLAKLLFPKLVVAGLLAGLGAVIGHVYPFYMGFKGGKGLAAFGGMVLAFNPKLFAFLLTLGVVLMLIVNYSFVVPMSAAVLFPVFAWLQTEDVAVLLIASAASGLVIVKHWGNIGRALQGNDLKIREFIMGKYKKS